MPHTFILRSKTYCSPASKSLRRAAGLGVGLLSLLSLSAGHAAFAGTVTWDGPSGADWFSNPTYWSNGSTPGAGDDAQNNTTSAMTLGQSTTINSFFSNGAFTLTGGTFSGNQANSASTITVNNVFTDNGGQINNFTVNQGTGGSLVFTTSGGNVLSGDIINANVDLASLGNNYVRLVGVNTVNGSIALGAGGGNGLHLQDGNSVLTLNGSLTGFGSVVEDNGGATFINNGTVNANSTGNTLFINPDNFTNVGTTEATNGGTLALAGNVTTTNTGLLAASSGGVLDISGTLNSNTGNSINSVGGTVNIQGATLLGTVNETAGSTLVFNTSGGNILNGATVNGNLDLASLGNNYVRLVGVNTVNGSIALGAGGGNGLHLQDGNSVLTLNGSLTGFGSVVEDNGGATFINNGTVNANSTGNTLFINPDNFTNVGTTEATNGGTLALAGNVTTTNTGLLAASSGGVLDISGTLNSNTGNSINSVGGTVNIQGATLLGTVNETAGSTLVFNTSGGNILNGATVNGNLDLASLGNNYVRLVGVNTVNGSIALGAGGGNGLHLQDGNSVLTLNGSLTGFGSVVEDNGGATFLNNGTVDANSGANPLTLALTTFNNTGTAEATNGAALDLRNTNTNAAAGSTLAATGTGSVVSIAGTFTGSGSNLITASNGGQVQVNGATLLGTINTDANTALFFDTNGGNILNGATVNGNLDLSSSVSYVRLIGANTVNGSIALGAGGGNGLHLQDGNSVLTLNGSLTGFGSVVEDNGGATFINNGTVNANSTGNMLNLGLSTFNNAGTAEATNGATLALNNTNSNLSGTLAAQGAGSVVSIAGTFTGSGSNLITASNGGQVQVNGATLLGTINTDASTALVFNTSGGNILNGATVNGNLDLASLGNNYVRLVGANTVNGNIALGAGGGNGLHLQDGNSVLTLNGSLTGFGSVVEDNGGATFLNNGTVNANSTGNTLFINPDNFTNAGTTEVQNGATLSVAGNTTTTDSGNILVSTGGTATFGNPNLTQTAGLTQVDGTLNASPTLTGGTLAGTGTVNGNVANNGGTVAAGGPFGTLAVNGAFSQTSGALDAVFSSTQNNLLMVSGAVTTGGTLSVSYLGAGPYTSGSAPFTFLDYGSLGTEPTNALGLTQYFSNETPISNDLGTIVGSNGFTYDLVNNTTLDALQLTVVTNGAPVPEASTTISLGALLALGGLGLWRVKRRTAATD